jgi:hypothetical protein
LLIFISANQIGLTVVSLPMNMPCPVPLLVKRMLSPRRDGSALDVLGLARDEGVRRSMTGGDVAGGLMCRKLITTDRRALQVTG